MTPFVLGVSFGGSVSDVVGVFPHVFAQLYAPNKNVIQVAETTWHDGSLQAQKQGIHPYGWSEARDPVLITVVAFCLEKSKKKKWRGRTVCLFDKEGQEERPVQPHHDS